MVNKGSSARVLATRPAPQNTGWCALLERAGFATLPVPVLAIEPVQEPAQRQAIKNLILDFDQFDKVIFVSQNAVRETLVWLDEYWPQLPMGIEYFAVGQKTAKLLSDNGIAAAACYYSMDSEELLALPQLQAVEGQKVLICRGAGGRPFLTQVLESRGARVVWGEFYRRVLPAVAVDALRESDFMSGSFREILSAFSGESLANLVTVLEQSGIKGWRQLPVLVPGRRVAEQAKQFEFSDVITALNATDSAMLAALQNWYSAAGAAHR